MDFKNLGKKIQSENADAWIIYDYECTNSVLISLIGKRFFTRKVFMIIDNQGEVTLLLHKIDEIHVQDLNFKMITYTSWSELMSLLKKEVSKFHTVLMEISENGLMPSCSYVDYGTASLIKSFGVELKTSANIIQGLTAPFKQEAYDNFVKSANYCNEAKNLAFEYIGKEISKHGKVSEYEVQQVIMKFFKDHNMVTDCEPVVAIGSNSNNPHYMPLENKFSYIKKGDLVLIDLWAKIDEEESVFGDITWMGYVGEEIPQVYVDRFNMVKEAIDNALAFLSSTLPTRDVCGYEVDDICRKTIAKYGYEKYFIHRTGHSISKGETPHGVGVNMDNFETHDTRHIIKNVAFSIEPGIYAPDFGVREEIDVYITDDNQPFVPSPRQKEIIKIKVD